MVSADTLAYIGTALHRFGWPALGVGGLTVESLAITELKLKILVLILTAISITIGIILQFRTVRK